MIGGDELLAVYGGMPPVMEKFVRGVGHSFMPFDGPRAVGATHGVMPLGITVSWARCTTGTPEGAGTWTKDVICHANAH